MIDKMQRIADYYGYEAQSRQLIEEMAENWEHKRFGQEETVVDWIAIQGPKIYKAWTEAGAV